MTARSLRLCIASDHPALPGHFPGAPILPGVVLLDEILHALEAAPTPWRIHTIKFHRIVPPGLALQLDYESRSDGRVHFELRCADALVASGALEQPPPAAPAAPSAVTAP
jgi:3-hydroxymyristoyl/3-hydroxydecanoyl-(acyl carrier protein) dehydratase